MTLLADLEPIGIAEIRSPPSSATPPVHVHHQHGEAFYVLAGELTFSFGEREVQAGHGTWVFIPPNVAHTSLVSGRDGARFLDLHAPSYGFGDFDQHPAPDGAADPACVLVRTGDTADAVEVFGNRIAFLADADETEGALGAIEFTAPQAFAGPPPHVHRSFHDIVYVLEGTLGVRLGEDAYTVGEGAFMLAPPGTAHTFSNPSDAPLRFLNFYVPGGFERFFRERAAATAAGVELTSRYDWERA